MGLNRYAGPHILCMGGPASQLVIVNLHCGRVMCISFGEMHRFMFRLVSCLGTVYYLLFIVFLITPPFGSLVTLTIGALHVF